MDEPLEQALSTAVKKTVIVKRPIALQADVLPCHAMT